MNKKGPIVLIEENEEDRKLFAKIFSDIGLQNDLLYFNTFNEAKRYIISKEVKPFLLFSNILQFHEGGNISSSNKHKNTGLESICPCLFYSILFKQCFVIDAYSAPTQSYFVSPYSEEKFKEVIISVIGYWNRNKTIKPYKTHHEIKHHRL